MIQQHWDNPASQEEWIRKVGQEVIELLVRKNKDYSDSFSKQYEKYGILSGLIRIDDKVSRLNNLVGGHKAEVSESIEDSMRDLAGYAILTLIEMTKEKEKK